MAEEEVKIYTSPTWPYCKMAKEYLSQQGIPYKEFDVTRDREALNEMVKISGARSVPVIAACNDVMVGFDKGRLEHILGCLKQKTDL